MNGFEVDTHVCPRPLRGYAWLPILLLLAVSAGLRAGPIYKCVGPDGPVAYQDTPCAETQRAQPIELAPEPAWQPSPQYALSSAAAETARSGRRAAPRRRASGAELSFECRAADGQVFYRHSRCPHSVAADPAAHSRGARTGSARASGASASLPVSASRIARSDACREIERAGAIGRIGHENDERVSTYERNLGRDPCR